MKALLQNLFNTNNVAGATWNRERSINELRIFVEQHHAALPADIDIQ